MHACMHTHTHTHRTLNPRPEILNPNLAQLAGLNTKPQHLTLNPKPNLAQLEGGNKAGKGHCNVFLSMQPCHVVIRQGIVF
jgi:hypothetical protein